MAPALALLAALLVALASPARAACPVDADAPPDTLLSVKVGDTPWQRLDRRALDAWPVVRLAQRRTVADAASAPAVDQSISYAGVPLAELVGKLAAAELRERGARVLVVEAVATDGYRAVFSWGELFNADGAGRVLVVSAQDGAPLDAYAGPLALRALADVRPGPRHVRNLCAIVVRGLPSAAR